MIEKWDNDKMAKEQQNNSKKLEKLNRLLWFAFGMLLITGGIYFYNFNGILSNDNAKWGTFGDFIGGTLNPIFALFSLFAIIYTIKIQTEELELTRSEMEKSTKAQEEQSISFAKQIASIKLQTFENTFFNLLEHYNNLIDPMYEGLDEFYSDLMCESSIIVAFQNANKSIKKTYFMTLYQLLKFVKNEEDKFNDDPSFDAKLYTNIIRATLDDTLLCLLAINCNLNGFEKFRFLVEEYHFFEHLNIYTSESIGPRTQEKILDFLLIYSEKVFGTNSELKTLVEERKKKNDEFNA